VILLSLFGPLIPIQDSVALSGRFGWNHILILFYRFWPHAATRRVMDCTAFSNDGARMHQRPAKMPLRQSGKSPW